MSAQPSHGCTVTADSAYLARRLLRASGPLSTHSCRRHSGRSRLNCCVYAGLRGNDTCLQTCNHPEWGVGEGGWTDLYRAEQGQEAHDQATDLSTSPNESRPSDGTDTSAAWGCVGRRRRADAAWTSWRPGRRRKRPTQPRRGVVGPCFVGMCPACPDQPDS